MLDHDERQEDMFSNRDDEKKLLTINMGMNLASCQAPEQNGKTYTILRGVSNKISNMRWNE